MWYEFTVEDLLKLHYLLEDTSYYDLQTTECLMSKIQDQIKLLEYQELNGGTE